MKSKIIVVFTIFASFLYTNNVLAEDFASKSDAEAIVKRAVAHVKKYGVEKAGEDFTNRKGEFVDNDLYVTMYNMHAVVLAHGQNKKSIGKDMIDLKDSDGKEFVKERMELAKKNKPFWQEYKFTDPVTKKVLPKEMYCETVSESVVCAGVYKR